MVKNVRPGALAGNLQPLHPEPTDDVAEAPAPLGDVVAPEGDLDARLAWVSEAEDVAEATARADAIWQHENDTNPDVDRETLSAQLRAAVHGSATIEVPGVEADTDGQGAAVNADTGEVTEPGDPLPPIEGQDGDPLPATGDDNGTAASEPTDGENAAQGADGEPDKGQNSTGSDDGGNAGS